MTTKDLRNSIEKVLGNNIRCLLPSYWWKRLFHQVADTIDEVNGVDIVSSEYALNRVDAPIGSLASIANKKAMKPSECYVPTDEDSNLTDEELVAKLTRLTSLEVSFPLPDITGVEAVAVLASEDAWLGFLVISEDFCAAIFAESPTNEKTFLLTSQSSVNSLNTFLKQHKFYYVGLDFEPEDTEEYIKETTELYDQIFTIVDCTSDVYVKGLAWERLAKEGESGSASVPSYTLYYTTYKVNEVTTMADKYINLNKEEYAKIFASQKAKENYLLQVVELGSHSEEFAPVDVELSWFSLADLNYADADFNVIVCSFLQMDGANQPQRRLVSFKSDGTAEYELIPTGDVKFLYYADGTYSLSAKEKAHNASAILSIKNSFDSSFTPSPIIIRYKIGSTKYLSLQGILSGNDAEGDGVSLTAFASDNVYFRFNYDLATGEPAKAKVIKTVDSELSDTSENPVQNKVVTEKLAELSEEIEGKEDKSNKTTTLSSASTNTQYPSAKAVYGALPTLETLPNGNLKVTINGVSKGFMPATPSGDPMHYTYVAAGCVYNEETNLWSYGGPDIEGSIKYLDDLTTKDVKNAYMVFPSFSHIAPFKGMWGMPIVKTRFVFCRLSKAAIVIDGAFQQNANLEFIYSDTDIIPLSMVYCLYECKSLRYLHARMQMQYITAQSALTMAFAGCNKLETIKLFKIKHSYDFKDSSLLSNDSILYMIKNEGATSAIAITLHADAYARAMADAEITAALAAHPNVSLAKA